MSSQRRETRWQRSTCAEHEGAWSKSLFVTALKVVRSVANGATAPPDSPVRRATISLHTGHPTEQLVWQVESHGTPPSGAGRRFDLGTPADRRSSFSHIPTSPGFASFHPTSPQAPAASSRRAERYDGKGNLYLLHAA